MTDEQIKKSIIRNSCIVLALFIAIALSAFCVYRMVVVKNETDKRLRKIDEARRSERNYAEEANEQMREEMIKSNQQANN